MNIVKNRLLLFALSLALVFSCTERVETDKGTLKIDPVSIECSSAAANHTVTVTTSASLWELVQTDGADWCTPGRKSGASGASFSIAVKKNLGDQRVATFTFSAEGCKDVEFTITQLAPGETPGGQGGSEVYPDAESGITLSPEKPDADGPCTITFKPSASSAISSELANCSEDLYVHIGVFYDEDWRFVPAEWGENIAKCKMTKVAANEYTLTLSPSIREFFKSGETPVSKIAMVIRNASGTKQTRPDQFASVVDNKYQEVVFEPHKVVEAPVPAGAVDGINYNPDGSVTFVLYDKGKDGFSYRYAYVIGEFSSWERQEQYMMKRDSDKGRWWYTMTGVDPDKEYMFQYHVGNASQHFRIPDPYTELIYDPWNDQYISSSTYPDMPAYPEGTKDRVGVFQVNRPEYKWEVKDYSIKDENSVVIYEMLFRDFSATKDIKGALEHLDYIKSLGVNVVELLPVQEFEGNESWGYNPCAYFAMDKAYGTREMYKKFIDECHKRDLGVFFDVVYNQATGAHPMARLYWNSTDNTTCTWNPWFNVTCPHEFGVFQDWNHSEPMVREHVKRNLKYLLEEYHVDGFRFDLTKGFTQNKGKESSYDASRVGYLKEYCQAIKAVNPKAMMICEHFVDAENADLGAAGMHMWGNNNYSFAKVVRGTNADLSYMYDPNCYRVGYMESHDEERICVGPFDASSAEGQLKLRRAGLAAAFSLLVPGPKMIWQFGELGYDYPLSYNGGNTANKPVKWEYFDEAPRKELYDTYAALLKFRNDNPAFFTKGAGFREYVDETQFTYGKFMFGEASGKSFCVMGNFDQVEKEITAQLPSSDTWYNYFDTTDSQTGSTFKAKLKPGEFRLLVNFK